MIRLSRTSRILAVCLGLAVPAAALAQEFPLTIEHAFGSTTIPARPTRVATVAWANHEVPLALGVVPVGFARANFGDDDDDGILPWVTERLNELGAEAPPLFDEGDGIDFEAVAASEPDVILAAYSGLSQLDYETLSKIAPVIAYRDGPWATDWRDMIRLNATGMGMADKGEALIGELEAEIAAVAATQPAIAGKTAMFVTHLDVRDLSVVRFYTTHDSRVKFLADLGLVSPASVQEASADGRFSGEISAEKIDAFADVDLVVSYGNADVMAAISGNPLTRKMPAVAEGAVVLLGNDPVGTAANPTPLSIPWVLEDYVGRLSEAARRSE